MNPILTKEFFDNQKQIISKSPSIQKKIKNQERALADFKSKFDKDALLLKSDDDLVNLLFQNGVTNYTDTLYYTLVFDKNLPVPLSVTVPYTIGAAFVNGVWKDASGEAINNFEKVKTVAKDIRDFVCKITDEVNKNNPDLYEQIEALFEDLFKDKIKRYSQAFYGKYIGCLFPNLFPAFYTDDWQRRVLGDDYKPGNLAENYRLIKDLMIKYGFNNDPLTFDMCISSNEKMLNDAINYEPYKTEKNKLIKLDSGTYSIKELFDKKITRHKSIEPFKKMLKNIANSHSDLFVYDKKNQTFTITKEELSPESQDDSDDNPVESVETIGCGTNDLFYGIPGCGKSYEVNERAKQIVLDSERDIIRTTFYLDYSYNDFVGQLSPYSEGDKIIYSIKPGPFAKALARSYKNPDKPVVLIIEEINRGNAPAIFGDIFQLLDRKNGESEYGIENSLISQYLTKEGVNKTTIKLPKNLQIFATMNSSDQNVFKLDTAFKRRWIMHRMTNQDSRDKAKELNNFDIGLFNIGWIDFVDRVNAVLIRKQVEEDRQLGYWFMSKDDLKPSEERLAFANKVLEYLWNDVLKFHDKSTLFTEDIHSLDELIDNYVRGRNVFVGEIINVEPSNSLDQ